MSKPDLNDLTDYYEKQYRSPATITRVTRVDRDRCAHVVTLYTEGESGSQGFGMILHKDEAEAAEFLASICRVFGISDSERLVGTKCEVLRLFPHNNEPIEALYSPDTGRTFSIGAWRRKHYPESYQSTPLDERFAQIEREIRHHRRRIEEYLLDATKLRDEYRPIEGEAP